MRRPLHRPAYPPAGKEAMQEISDVLGEQTPGDRNTDFRVAVWVAVNQHYRTGTVVAVPTQGEQQERTLRAVDEIIRRHRG